MSKKNKLPQNVIDHLNKNLMFNKFGLVNIASLKAQTDCEIPNDELEQLIQNKFGHEMHNGEVEFIKPILT